MFALTHLVHTVNTDDLYPGRHKLTPSFDLPHGSSATIVIKRSCLSTPLQISTETLTTQVISGKGEPCRSTGRVGWGSRRQSSLIGVAAAAMPSAAADRPPMPVMAQRTYDNYQAL
jgi:hypothetical protein